MPQTKELKFMVKDFDEEQFEMYKKSLKVNSENPNCFELLELIKPLLTGDIRDYSIFWKDGDDEVTLRSDRDFKVFLENASPLKVYVVRKKKHITGRQRTTSTSTDQLTVSTMVRSASQVSQTDYGISDSTFEVLSSAYPTVDTIAGMNDQGLTFKD